MPKRLTRWIAATRRDLLNIAGVDDMEFVGRGWSGIGFDLVELFFVRIVVEHRSNPSACGLDDPQVWCGSSFAYTPRRDLPIPSKCRHRQHIRARESGPDCPLSARTYDRGNLPCIECRA